MTPSRLTFHSEVTDIRLESRSGIASRWHIALDRTLFTADSPRGTLIAVAPSGVRLEVLVLDVHAEDGTTWHIVDKPLTAGTQIVGILNELPA